MLRRYWFCGSGLECEFDLPELPSSPQSDGGCIRIVVDLDESRSIERSVQHWESGPGWTIAIGRSGASYVLRLAEDESYIYHPDSNTITLDCEPSEAQRNGLLHQILPRVLDHHGRFLMHASAVGASQGVLSFVGASGRGKSTLAAALDAGEASLLSDDCIEFFVDGEAAVCHPTYRSLRLWRDSADALPPSDSYDRIESDDEKLRFHSSPDNGTAPDLPISVIYMLADPDRPVDETAFGPVAPALAVSELLKHSFRLDPTDIARARSAFNTAADVVQRVPVFTLAYPRDYDRLGEVTQRILEHASRNGAKQIDTP